MSLTVTVVDDQTGETETGHVPDGDYLIIVTQPAFVGSIQTYGNGTHVITVKGRRAGQPVDPIVTVADET